MMTIICSCGTLSEPGQSNTVQASDALGFNESTQVEQTRIKEQEVAFYTKNTKIADVQNNPVFGEYGRFIFPIDSGYMSGDTLGNLGLAWYNYIDPDKTVEICNYMKEHAANGETIFFDIYTEEEKRNDPAKDTGLFFLKGDPGAKFAVINAGGGFSYVGAMHDSYPHGRRS